MDDQPTTSAERRCPICGAIVPLGARYCPSCGNRQPDSDADAPSFSAALDDILVDQESTESPPPEDVAQTPPISVWGPNDPVVVEMTPDEPLTYRPEPKAEPVEEPVLQRESSSTSVDWATTTTAPPSTATATGWATTPEHWTNQQQPPLRQQGWRGNRTLWLVFGILGMIVVCCCGFIFLVSMISATETSAVIDGMNSALR